MFINTLMLFGAGFLLHFMAPGAVYWFYASIGCGIGIEIALQLDKLVSEEEEDARKLSLLEEGDQRRHVS